MTDPRDKVFVLDATLGAVLAGAFIEHRSRMRDGVELLMVTLNEPTETAPAYRRTSRSIEAADAVERARVLYASRKAWNPAKGARVPYGYGSSYRKRVSAGRKVQQREHAARAASDLRMAEKRAARAARADAAELVAQSTWQPVVGSVQPPNRQTRKRAERSAVRALAAHVGCSRREMLAMKRAAAREAARDERGA